MYNHNKAQQSKNRVHISRDILYADTVMIKFMSRIHMGPVLEGLRIVARNVLIIQDLDVRSFQTWYF